MPRDGFGREIDYLRISLIDHCNLRCVYCMPLNGIQFTPPAELLGPDEIERVVRVATRVGFRKFRLTGGEPTLRSDLVEIVGRIASVPGVADLSMTTNGILLPRLAKPLAEAGLRRVNVHIDSLHPGRLQRIMRFGTVEEIRAGIEAAEEAGLVPIKLNAVVARGYNDEDVVDLARLTLERDWHVRFIELMPLGGGECAKVAVTQFVSNQEVRARIEAELGPLAPLPPSHPSEESENFRLPGARGVVGFISPVSRPYCGSCNRMRLTADGRFHLCLLRETELDVRAALRRGDDEAVAEILLRAVRHKPSGHALEAGVAPEERSMYQLGG
ncbi:MAG: cyclic pyranopterin monophosphate synthase [Candidatus Binatia bacterium]|nr:MAG: cyclic pyranopterin monophosphate synthase [Candidatus Binatia bacterium]